VTRRRGRRVVPSVMLILTIAGAATSLAGQQPPPRLSRFLHRSIGLDSAQVRDLTGGKAVVKVLETPLKRDVAVFGAIAVAVPRNFYMKRVWHIAEWLRGPTRLRFGLFSDPAQLADVRGVTIDRHDVQALKNCRPGDCDVKLPASEMERIHQEVDWSAADPGPQVDAYARRRMVAYVTAYRAHGDSVMVEYDDKGDVRASDAFSALLAESPYIYEYVAPFHHYLAAYPHGRLDGVHDILYWSEDALHGLRPILSITHLSAYAPPDHPGTTVVARKQLYADHYFEAAFDLMLVVDRPAVAGNRGIYLVVVRRFRFDHLPGGIFNIRGKVIGKLRNHMRKDLEREQESSQEAFSAAGTSAGRARHQATPGG
jgi:hypothetical protein